jgi:hypothetical protein
VRRVAGLVVGLAVLAGCGSGPRSDAEVATAVADTLTRDSGQVVTAECTPATREDVWNCRVRDDGGRVGTASATVVTRFDRTTRGSPASGWTVEVRGGATVDPSGRLEAEYGLGRDAADPAGHEAGLAVSRGLQALGHPLADALATYDCPETAVGETVTCTGGPLVPTVEVLRTGEYTARVTAQLPSP